MRVESDNNGRTKPILKKSLGNVQWGGKVGDKKELCDRVHY